MIFPPTLHSQSSIQILSSQQRGDIAVPDTKEQMEGTENMLQTRAIKLKVGGSHNKEAAGCNSIERAISLCFSQESGSRSSLTSAHLSSGSEAFFVAFSGKNLVAQQRAPSPLLLTADTSVRSWEALLYLPLKAFPLQRFFTFGNIQSLPASPLPTPENVPVLELLMANL